MTEDDIRKAARESGCVESGTLTEFLSPYDLNAFALAIRDAALEEAAAECNDLHATYTEWDRAPPAYVINHCVAAIRAKKGQA